jgi:inosine/xanthosine triphosphatase
MKIIVASKNPIKINTTKQGFEKVFPNEIIEVIGVSVNSGVSEQPRSDGDTLKGAISRVNNAAKLYKADYWVGMEAGLEEIGKDLLSFSWIVIKSKMGKYGKGKTSTYVLPEKIAELIRQGKELGEADDIVFKKRNSKQMNGAVGILTNDLLTRTSFYETAVILALIPFKNPSLY